MVNGSKGKLLTILLFISAVGIAIFRAVLIGIGQHDAADSLSQIEGILIGVFGGSVVLNPISATPIDATEVKTMLNKVLYHVQPKTRTFPTDSTADTPADDTPPEQHV